MNIKYRVLCRYELFGPNGIEWSNWFPDIGTPISDTEDSDEIKEFLKNAEKIKKDHYKLLSHKREYKVEAFDQDKEQKISEMTFQPAEKRKRGRPKKEKKENNE